MPLGKHKCYVHIHSPSYCSGTTWHKETANYNALHNKYAIFLPTYHPQLFCNQLPFCKLVTLNSRDWFSLHIYTSWKLWATGRKDKVKLGSLIILVKLVISQCNRYVQKKKPANTSHTYSLHNRVYALTTYFSSLHNFFSFIYTLKFPLGFQNALLSKANQCWQNSMIPNKCPSAAVHHCFLPGTIWIGW